MEYFRICLCGLNPAGDQTLQMPGHTATWIIDKIRQQISGSSPAYCGFPMSDTVCVLWNNHT